MNYKKLVVDSGVRMASSGLTVATYGNISIRDPETGLVYLTPSGMNYNIITEDDIVVCDLDGNVVDGHRKPTIETTMHLAIMKARPDVNAVIHTHALYSTLFATMAEDIPLIIDEAAQLLVDTVKSTPKHDIPGSQELADATVKALGDKAMACLINSHGAVCVGGDIDGAFTSCTVLEMTAQIYYMMKACNGTPSGIPAEDCAIMQDFVKNHYGQGK
ncbi:MAG: class II aldolase/adducin family protein [Lachnospiraceae bacterium]|nr:class II aldolase/adducin family protein [Lachnospiraceae bacterium]